jgi:N4-(beta-N-acetylglucosaminyl)-L-asparaginase
MKRRKAIKYAFGASLSYSLFSSCEEKAIAENTSEKTVKPIVISTWINGIEANIDAWKILEVGGSSLDAVEKGVMNTEADPDNSSVGYGGLPDRDGIITLDACIMDHLGNCGSVAYLKDIKHPISVARKVMENTPHVMLVGAGARKFALESGFEPIDLHTENSKKAYQKWLVTSEYKPIINIENHDTIGMLAIDQSGNMSGACTTSGLAYKMAGRVGDSPIIGAGLYIDNEVGGAVATGLGEEIIKASASSIVVELMRQGYKPSEACQEVVERVMKKTKAPEDTQVCILAMDMNGQHGAYAIYQGFNYAVHDGNNRMIDSPYSKEWK